MSLCKYSEIFGKPGEGSHQYRIFNIAISDVLLTIVGAFFIYLIINAMCGLNISYWCYLLGLFIVGIGLHRIFCVRTTVDRILFG